MSGGHFDYKQYHINDIANSVEQEIRNNGQLIPFDLLERWDKEMWEDKNGKACNEKNYKQNPIKRYEYPKNVIQQFKVGHILLTLASIYAQRIDWLLSGDDGEESFINRINEDLLNCRDTYVNFSELLDIVNNIKSRL